MGSNIRTEYEALRRKWMKEHGWKGFVCARCGHYSKSNHLHHIREICYGGENEPTNLIPLCGECHREWDNYDKGFPFSQFLVTFPGVATPVLHKPNIARGLSVNDLLHLAASVYRAVNEAKAGAKLEEMDVCVSDLEKEQNEFFSAYPYSDESWRAEQMRLIYGEFLSTGVRSTDAQYNRQESERSAG